MNIFDLVFGMNMLAVIFFFTGTALLIVEVFIPGFGVAGIMGVTLMFLSAVMVGWGNPLKAIWLVIIAILLIIVFLFVIIKVFTSDKSGGRIILKNSAEKEKGYVSTDDLTSYMGKEGIVVSTLRPSGKVDFDGTLLDVVSDHSFVDKGKKVKVIKVEGGKVVVKEIF